jgi:putative tryptophan/tyrosine transport system substrate-binding protein
MLQITRLVGHPNATPSIETARVHHAARRRSGVAGGGARAAAAMFGTKDNVVAGGLMSYAPDLADLTRRAATYIDKILKGAKPADMPVDQASKYQLVINLKTAKALGLELPAQLLALADEVIE